MLYPLAIQAGDRNTAFGVIVPDLPVTVQRDGIDYLNETIVP